MKEIGFPRMVAPEGFKRDFSPDFVSWVSNHTHNHILMEKSFGTDLGYKPEQYLDISNLKIVPRTDLFSYSDIIFSLTSPSSSDINLIKPNATLIAMLHLDTHPARKNLLEANNIMPISLDELKDSCGQRLVQDYYRTAWNAVTEGFIQASKMSPNKKSIGIYLIGFGNLGKEAANAVLSLGKGQVTLIPTNHLHSELKYQRTVFNTKFPDMLIDASKRSDLTKHILTSEDIKLLPDNCVIVDISADCYQKDGSVVKGIQGIPTGNETQYVFLPDDPAWENSDFIPVQYQLPKELRRVVISNYAWPSYGTNSDRIANMQKYEQQLRPLIKSLLKTNS